MMRRIAFSLVALLVLWAPFIPIADPWTGRVVAGKQIPLIVLGVILLIAVLALFGRRLGRVGRGIVAAAMILAAGLQIAAALVQAMLDRPLDLYFDIPQVPALLGLLGQAAGPWAEIAAPAFGAAAALALWAGLIWAIGAVAAALAGRRAATAALAACIVLALFRPAALSRDATDAVADQGARLVRAAAVMEGFDHRYDATLDSPQPKGDLAALAGHDVFLVFVESYGTVLFDDPRFRDKAAPAFAAFAQTLRREGYAVRTGRAISPVFGGGSWLAHGTIESGLKLDPFLDKLLVASGRRTLAQDLRASGHRTVAVMPGIKKPWPEASFWGFRETMFAKDLGYGGPAFGWFAIPDQYTLETFAERDLPPSHAPVFAEIVLVSSHTPFAPVPPYIEPWRGASSYAGIAPHAADWSALEQPYFDSIVYDFRTLAGWLSQLEPGALVIVLGDHQPPGIASGATMPWTVPVHVMSRDPNLVAPFARLGYVEGVLPPAQGKGMESFLRDFLNSFSTPGAS
jgi:hypothetical protein